MRKIQAISISAALALLVAGASASVPEVASASSSHSAIGKNPTSARTFLVHSSAAGGWVAQTRDASGSPVPIGTGARGAGKFVTGPATPPLGIGSAELRTGNGSTGGDCSAELRNSAYSGV